MADQIASLYAKIGADDRGFNRSMDSMSNRLQGFGKMAQQVGGVVGTAVKIAGAATAVAVVGVGAAVAKAGTDFNAMQEQAEIAFTTMLGSAEKSQAFLSKMQKFATTTPFEYPGLLTASKRMVALGFAADDVLPMLTNIGDAVAGLGGDQQTLDRVVTALGQIKAKGKVQAEEMMQLTENGIAAWDMLAKKLNVDVATAMDMVTKRQVDASVGIEAINEGMAAKFGGMMAKQSKTWSGMISNLKDSFGILSGRVMKPFFDFFEKGLSKLVDFTSSDAFIAGIDKFAGKVTSSLEYVVNAVERFRNMFAFELTILGSDNASFSEKLIAVWDMVAKLGLKIWQALATELQKLLPKWLGALWEWAKGLWQWIVDSTPKALAALWEWAKGLWGWFVANLPTWFAALWEWAKAMWQWIVEVTPIVIAKMQELGWALLQSISLWANGMGPLFRDIWYLIVDIFGAGYALVTGNWDLFWEQLGKIARNFKGNIWPVLVELGQSLWQWIADAIPQLVLQLGVWADRLFQFIGQALPVFLNLMLGWGTALVKWIGDAVPRALAALVSFIQGLRGEGSATGANALGQMVQGWGIKLWMWIVDTIPKIAPAFMEFLGAVHTAGQKIWDALVTLASEWGKTVDFWLQSMGISFVTWKDIAIGSVIAFTVMFWPAISAAFGAVMGAITALVAAWAPILALFAGAILAVALLRNAWESDWMGIRTTTLEAMDFLQAAFAPLLEVIKAFGGDALKEIWAWVTGNETNFDAVKKIWEAAKAAFGVVFDAIGAKLAEWGQLAWSWLKEKFPNAAAALELAVSNIKRNFAELWAASQPLIQKLQDAWTLFTSGAAAEGGAFGVAMQRLRVLLDGLWTIMITSAGFFINTIINLFTLVVQMIDGDWTGAWQTLKQIAKGAWDSIVTITATAVDTLLGLFGKNRDDVVRWFQEIRGTLRAMAEQFRQWGRDVIDGLRNGIQDKWGSLTSWFSGLWGQLADRFKAFFGIHSPSTLFAGYGDDMMSGLANGIGDASSKVYDALGILQGGMTDQVSSTLGGLYANVGSTGTGMGIKPGQAAIAPFVKLEEAVGQSKAGDIFESLRTLASDANQAFRAYGVVEPSILQFTDKLANAAALNGQGGVGGLKTNIDNLVQQLNNTGVANNFGAGAKSGLLEFSDYLDILMQGGVYGTTPPTSPTSDTGGSNDQLLGRMVELLAIIVEQLRKNGALNHDDLGAVRAYLSNIGADYGGLVSNTAGLR